MESQKLVMSWPFVPRLKVSRIMIYILFSATKSTIEFPISSHLRHSVA